MVGTGSTDGPVSGPTPNNTRKCHHHEVLPPAPYYWCGNCRDNTVVARIRAGTRNPDRGTTIPTEGSTGMGVTIADMSSGFVFAASIGLVQRRVMIDDDC